MSEHALVTGFTVTHRRYVPYAHAHYGGNLVDGAYGLGMFGDVATELCVRTDGDEGLFAGYSSVEFLAPIQAGDVIEATATLTRIGNRSRGISFEARVVCRAAPERGASSADVLDPPVLVTRAEGTVVVPAGPATATATGRAAGPAAATATATAAGQAAGSATAKG